MPFSKANETTGHLKGVDVSQWQSSTSINWNTLKNIDGIDFVYLRASKGYDTMDVDTEVVNHIQNAKGVGLPVGFYHFSSMKTGANYSLTEAETEAKFFADTISTKMTAAGYFGYGDLLPCLDLERPDPNNPSAAGLSSQQIIDWAKKFCDYFKTYTGRQVIVYVGRYYCEQFGINSTNNSLKSLPLWCPEYYSFNSYLSTDAEKDTPRSYAGWSDYTIWQYSESGSLQAYNGPIDLNWSKALFWFMPPSAPTGLKAIQKSSTEVTLIWNKNPEGDVIGYNLYKDGVWHAWADANATSYVVSGLTEGSTYKFKINARDQYGDLSPNSSEVTITLTTVSGWTKGKLATHLFGLDVSKYQPASKFNYQTLKDVDGVKFMYIKATGGGHNFTARANLTTDVETVNHIRGAKGVGIPVGFYHFAFADYGTYSLTEAETEAKHFADTIANCMSQAGNSGYGDLMPVLDLEQPEKDYIQTGYTLTMHQLHDWAKRFVEYFENYTGRKMMIYTSRYFITSWGFDPATSWLKNRPLWSAEYYPDEHQSWNSYLNSTAEKDRPKSYGGWSDWTVWQFGYCYGDIKNIQGFSATDESHEEIDVNWAKDLDEFKRPSTPTGLSVTPTGDGELTLDWDTNPEKYITGYNIYKDGAYLTTVSGSTNVYKVTGLGNGVTASFKVQALNKWGDPSPTCSPVNGTTNTPNMSQPVQTPIPSAQWLQWHRSNTQLRNLNKFRIVTKRR